MSWKDAILFPFRDIGKAFSYGLDLPENISRYGLRGATAGFHPHVMGAGVGATAGLSVGMMLEEADPMATTVGGAVIGGSAVPATALFGAGAISAGSFVLRNSDKILYGVGRAGVGLGNALYRGFTGPQLNESSMVGRIGNRVLDPVNRYTGIAGGIMRNFADYEPRREMFDERKGKMVKKGGFKIKPLGWGVIGAGALIGTAKETYSAVTNIRMGERDPYITRATPRIPSYVDNAGATGDLVFALNANRRG